MADTNFRGPINSMGSLEVESGNTATIYPQDGVSMQYQGNAMPDIRSGAFAKDGFRPGQQLALIAGSEAWVCDNIPQARVSSQLATTQIGTSALAVSLATVGLSGLASVASIAVGVPIIPIGTSVVTYAIALDFGFTTGSTVANSSTVHVIDNRIFHIGQWLIVANVGNSASTRSLVTQVQSIATANTTGLTIAPVAAATLTSVPIGQGNLFGSGQLPLATQFGPAAASASAHSYAGAMAAGLAKVINPRETLARNLSVTCVTSTEYSALVSGWDLWGNPMTEVITITSQTAAAGDKAFKYIGSIVSGTTSPVGISFGLGDTFGYPYRVDEWDQTDVTWAGSRANNFNGFVAAQLTSPATNTSGDVRGTVQISTAVLTGVLATSVSAVATNGTSRLTMKQTFGTWNQIAGTPINTVPMFGVSQSTA